MYVVIEMLVGQNIRVGGHRTSIRLEPDFWTALADIAQRENLTIDRLCSEIDRHVGDLSRTAAVRVFVMMYMTRLSQRDARQLQHPLTAANGQSAGSSIEDDRWRFSYVVPSDSSHPNI